MKLLPKIKKKYYKLTHPIQGEIWCLHRVLQQRSQFPANRELELTPDYLEQLILSYLHKGYTFVAIDDLLQTRSSICSRKWVNISFDDGFADVYQNAFPIFRKYNIPFTLYLSTDFPDQKADIWWYQMEEVFENNYVAYEEALGQYFIEQEHTQMRNVFHQQTQTQADLSLTKQLSLSWQQLRDMLSSGLLTIGSHSCSHPALTLLSDNELEEELIRSATRIKEQLCVEVCHFSYPHSIQNERVQQAVKQAGYKSATIGFGGSIRKGDNPYCLPRKYIVMS